MGTGGETMLEAVKFMNNYFNYKSLNKEKICLKFQFDILVKIIKFIGHYCYCC
jgi:hypothetical protein